MVFLQILAYYLILLDLQLINFPRACTISQEASSRFPHFLQPWLLHPTSVFNRWLMGLYRQAVRSFTAIKRTGSKTDGILM